MGIFPLAFCVKEVKDDSHLRNIVKAVFLGSQRSEFSLSCILAAFTKNPDFQQQSQAQTKDSNFFLCSKSSSNWLKRQRKLSLTQSCKLLSQQNCIRDNYLIFNIEKLIPKKDVLIPSLCPKL